MKSLKLKVPNPCKENWTKMLPESNGRFCNSCEKIVVDFTKMSDEELINYFSINVKENICGQFYESQLEPKNYKELDRSFKNKYSFVKNKISLKLLKVLTLFNIGILMGLFGCKNPKETTGKVEVDSTKCNSSKIEDNIMSGDTLLNHKNNRIRILGGIMR